MNIFIDTNVFLDVVQYGAAERSGCELIVTNDKAFFQKDIRLISSSGFMREFL